MPATKLDPLNIAQRTYKQYARLLDMLEDPDNAAEVTIPQLINALKALEAYTLKSLGQNDDDREQAGSAVRKYAAAFSQGAGAGAARSRAPAAGSASGRAAAVADDSDDDTDHAAA